MLLAGCTWPSPLPLRMPDPGLPTHVDVASDPDSLRLLAAALYQLTDAPGAPASGRAATDALYRELLVHGVFSSLALEPAPPSGTLSREAIIADARQKGHTVVILGRLLRYYQGSLFAPTEVRQEIEVLQLELGAVRTLWLARSEESVAPRPSHDWIFVKLPGTPAPEAYDLLTRHAVRFCRMLLPPAAIP
jgi:hypothetical protein